MNGYGIERQFQSFYTKEIFKLFEQEIIGECFTIAKYLPSLTKKGAKTVVGGGETLDVLDKAGIAEEQISHISTGGGSSIEATEKGWYNLPAIEAMMQTAKKVMKKLQDYRKSNPKNAPSAPGEDNEQR